MELIMTNEEKAKEIAKDKARLIKLYNGETQCKFDCQDAALEMAEWKDNQLKEEFKVPEYCKTTEEIFNFIGNDVYAKGYNKAKDYDKRFLIRKRDSLLRKYEDTKDESVKAIIDYLDELIKELFTV